jgi:Uma2 family endonuclease
MSPTKRVHGKSSGRLVRKLSVYLEQHPIGEIYIAEAGFRAGPRESLYCPAASSISAERDATLRDDEFVPFAPDIAIEVWSPEEAEERMATKTAHYLAHGARRVWVLRPQDRTLRVYRLDGPSQVLQGDDPLTGDEVLPGFSVRVGDLFGS